MESTAAPSIPNYGGQAVIEGVMMRSRRAMAVAVRHPAGHTVVHVEPLRSARQRSRWARLPLIRGMVLLWDTLVLGMRALAFSANVAAAEDLDDGTPAPTSPDDRVAEEAEVSPEESAAMPQGVLWGTMAFAFTMGIGLFFVLPLLLVRTVDPLIPWSVASNLIEGLVRLAILLGYIALIGLLADVRRVFAYHGAEHKAINAFEAGVPLEREQVSRYGTVHPRCGTSFLLVVVVLSIAIFSLLGRPALPARLASRPRAPVVSARRRGAARAPGFAGAARAGNRRGELRVLAVHCDPAPPSGHSRTDGPGLAAPAPDHARTGRQPGGSGD